jgi:hypothetical protein
MGAWVPYVGDEFSSEYGIIPVPFVIPANGSLSRDYSFTPPMRGHAEERTTVAMGGSGQICHVWLSGTGVAPASYLDEDKAYAGYVRIGTSATCSLTVVNVGDGNLSGLGEESNLRGTVGGVSSGGLSGPGGSFSLQDWGSQLFEYACTATQHGPHSAVVTCHLDNGGFDMNMAYTTHAVLGYTAVGPTYSADSAPGSLLDFGEVLIGDTGLLTLQISNITQDEDGGDSTLTDLGLLAAVLTGPDASAFSLPCFSQVNPSGIVVHKGQSLVLDLCFAPTGGGGDRLAYLCLITDQGAPFGAPGSMVVYTLQGSAVPEPTLVGLLGMGVLALAFRKHAPRRRQV